MFKEFVASEGNYELEKGSPQKLKISHPYLKVQFVMGHIVSSSVKLSTFHALNYP
jgi:hypothetical protein